MLNINVKYHDPGMPPLEMIEQGNWTDVRAVGVTKYKFYDQWDSFFPAAVQGGSMFHDIIGNRGYCEAHNRKLRFGRLKAVDKDQGTPMVWRKDAGGSPFIEYDRFDILRISLGFSLECPDGYEGHLLPRSSTFDNYGFIQVNSMGVIDTSFRGDNDIWVMEVVALAKGRLFLYDRVGQLEIRRASERITFNSVQTLGNPDRGGLGTTGVK